MIRLELPALVERLNPLCRHMLEEAAALCVNQQQAEIRVEHLLLKMLDTPLSDARLILTRAEVDVEALRPLLLPLPVEGASREAYPAFSPLLVEWLQDSWLLASAELGQRHLRSGVLLLVLLMTATRYLAAPAVRLLSQVNRELLRQQFEEWVLGSAEQPDEAPAAPGPARGTQTGWLARFSQNVTEQARQGRLDPVLCRDHEIDLMIDILCRRRKNNPIVVGEAGVGKSALIEGLALRIVDGEVPDKLKAVELLSLDLGAMQAGAAVKGEFEKRFKGVMQEVKEASRPIIVFIDEAHTLIGAGNQAGGLDVSNLIKPALARGELRTIAATTWKEYKQYVEKDAALSRRFQLVPLKEPSTEEATVILRGLRHLYEREHGVLIEDEALVAAASLSARYLCGRQLPDKAIDVLDTASARVAINMTTPPRALSRLHNQRQQLALESEQLQRQARIGLLAAPERLRQLQAEIDQTETQRARLEADWRQQQGLVQQIVALRGALLAEAPQLELAQLEPALSEAEASERLTGLEAELAALQQQDALVSPHVGRAQVAEVIAEWTGVPLTRLSLAELEVVTDLPAHLARHIKGQSLAIAQLHQHLLTARADLRRPGRPLGAFLLVGPSGVGKTETVLQIAELLFGGRQYLTTINMSEYQEKHTVSRLIGSPPGYVGFGEGGVLTEAIRQKPYSVVLLDEVEKAHPDVLNLFYQAFDKGELADGEGRLIDCKNLVFFLTSNLGYQTIVEHADQPEPLLAALYPELAAFFRPALLARMEVVPYLPLDASSLLAIVNDKLARLTQRLVQRFAAVVDIEPAVPEEILRRANRSENGARMLESIIDGALLPPLSLQLLQRMAAGQAVGRVSLRVQDGEFVSRVED